MNSIAIIDVIGLTYDGNTLQKRGLGGSESAVILMSKELKKLGFDVTVFNNCVDSQAEEGVYDGVKYVDISRLLEPNSYQADIVISIRTVTPFAPESYWPHLRFDGKRYQNLVQSAKLKVLWMHDTFCDGDQFVEELLIQGYIDEMFTLSDFHTSYVTNCWHGGKRRNFEVLKNKVYITRNGMTKYNDWVDIKSKDKNLFVYNASVTKGLNPLLKLIWPEVKKQIPQAQLKVIGGFYRFRDNAEPDAQEKTLREYAADPLYKQLDVEFTGVIKQSEIAEILSKASFFIFPGAFPETFGISSLESLYYNTPILGCRFGALEETGVDQACYLLDYAVEPNNLFPEINQEEQAKKFIEMTVNAYYNTYLHQQKMYACNIVRDFCGWDSVALQWKQHFYKKLKQFLPINDYRKVKEINYQIHKIFGRRFSNLEEWTAPVHHCQQKIVVISTFYNSELYLKNCIESVAQQDYDNFHFYIIDDASTDNSFEIVKQTVENLPEELNNKITLIQNVVNLGAVRNQVSLIRTLQDDDIVMILDGDDWLVNEPDIFQYYNNLYHNDTEFSYGSCWSLVDNIPLISQPYPEEVKQQKNYRNYHFNWIMPYTHLRTFRKKLINNVSDDMFKDDAGDWFKAGGDGSVFYSVLEQADPNKVKVVSRIVYNYNDTNPLNDYKVNGEEQTKTARKIITMKKDSVTFKIPEPLSVTDIIPKVNTRSALDIIKEMGIDVPNKKTSVAPSPRPLSLPPVTEKPVVKDRPEIKNSSPKKKILIAIPTARNIEVDTFKSIYDLEIPEGYEADFRYSYGYRIDQVRNLIVSWADKYYDYLFSVDSDISFPADTLKKMLAHDKDMVTGLYIQRIPGIHALELFKANQWGGVSRVEYKDLPENALVEVDSCGFGCVLVKSEVIRGIGYPQFHYHHALDHKDTISEDVDFCLKAKKKGYRIFADTSIKCDHTGSWTFRVGQLTGNTPI